MTEMMIMETTQLHEPAAHAHPWRRFFARALDLSIYQIFWSCFQYIVLRWHPHSNFFVALFVSYIVLGLMILIEPLLLSTWGSTPGKAILGLVVRNMDGSKLSYSEGLTRIYGVFASGYGYGIPFYNIVRSVKSHSACLAGETMEWDLGLHYQLNDAKSFRVVMMVVANAAVLGLAVLMSVQAQMPLYRGDLTPKKYAANVNDVLSRPNVMSYGQKMTESGQWVKDQYAWERTQYVFFDGPPPNHNLTIENGIVTGVSFQIERMSGSFQHSYASQKHILVMAFLCAHKEMSIFTFQSYSQELTEVLNDMSSYTREIAGVRIIHDVQYSGYTSSGPGSWLVRSEERRVGKQCR